MPPAVWLHGVTGACGPALAEWGELSTTVATAGMAGTISGTLAMGAHWRLGEESPLNVLDRSVLERICVAVDIVVPDAVRTLSEAVGQALPGQRIVVKKGEYTVGATDANSGFVGSKAAGTVLSVSQRDVTIVGEQGAVLRGMLVLEPGSSGRLHGLKIVDGGDSCIKAQGGEWTVENCHLQCGHAAAIHSTGDAIVSVMNSRIGGEEPCRAVVTYHEAYGSIQEFGLSKRACYAVLAKGRSSVKGTGCSLVHCSEAAVFLSDRASIQLEKCNINHCVIGFVSGYGCGNLLSVKHTWVGNIAQMWFDGDRPQTYQWSDDLISSELDGSGLEPELA